ncbi:deoxyribose-phosphate aldolase [Lactiplantibacillus daowaiensis]|uniref:Deoxyribose-phosphate aldolase n=1 Tax=Lactiplantibacillus daowaiensis TaxID=2559918 RepID=A0ABW1RYM9_9LACO|nr:deoxyribose-phosphate aldolase [Lactiplantibacillus daowaiensis]
MDTLVSEKFFLSDYIDHTLLSPTATKAEIKQVVMDAQKFEFHSVMVNPCWVKYVHALLNGLPIKTATVIGFPLGANTMAVKVSEAEDAIQNGADELDMVMNIGMFKSGDEDYVGEEIERIKLIAHRQHRILKVIIETALLTDEEKKAAARLVSARGADFIKTSTGFSTGGATIKDVALLKKYVTGTTLVKASGGIHNRQEAMAMIDNGADRLGTSQSVAIVTEP